MGLFGSKKQASTQLKKVRPTVVRTQNVAKELMGIAKSYDVKVETLDFNLLEVQTYTRMQPENGEAEWEEISSDEIYELDDKSALLNPHFQIKQVYEIEIYSKSKDDEDPFKEFNAVVGANATKCKVYMSIREGSKLSYFSRLDVEFLMHVNKLKVRANILINIFDEMLDDAISKIVAHVRVEEDAEYTKNETILIAEGYEPTPTRNDALVLHYDRKEELDEHQKADYASRGFIQSVQKDELLIEYVKPQLGKPGRNCRGEYMNPHEPLIEHEPTFKIDDTIKVEESKKSIEYRAKENGYIALENETYVIKTEVDVSEISFKTTGSITAGVDSDVNISVKEADAVKDAIGNGMTVEVSEINIDGNVGSNANVIAQKVDVGGQTHKTATLKAEHINVNIHKGSAIGKNVHITRLEHGNIDADKVDITQAVGGDIKAKEIEIELCGSYVKATATKYIEIRKLHGSENIFTIDPLLKKDAKKGFGENEKQIEELTQSLKNIKKEIEKYTQLIKDNTASFNDVKKRLIHYKKNGVKMPESFVKQYKQFQKMQEHLKHIQEEKEKKSDQLNLLTTRTASFQDNIFDARIINRDRWVGHNEIRFKLVEPPIELVYKPQEGSSEKIFGLVEIDDGEYQIEAMEE